MDNTANNDDGRDEGVEPAILADEGLPPIVIRPRDPFDLRLSLEAAVSFFPAAGPAPTFLSVAIEAQGAAAIVKIWQSAPFRLVRASSMPRIAEDRLRSLARWLISADLDLRPFYALAAPHPVMGGVILALPGLKPLRPPTLFEMALIAITEQQLSLAAAFHIRKRLVRRFGTSLGDLWLFPSPERLAAASLHELRACGLSRRKAEYVRELARRIAQGALEFEALRRESDERIREALVSNRGFGEWSAQYILSRGVGRPDSLPSGDTGLRRVVGRYLAGGRRLTAAELEQVLVPFRPFRGLAAFYLAVHWRLRQHAGSRPMEAPEIADASRKSTRQPATRFPGTADGFGPGRRDAKHESDQ